MEITSLTHPCNYDRILDEETPQAKRIARFIASYDYTRVLDVGCGPANYVEAMREYGLSAFGVDIDERCLRSVYCFCMDLTQEPCPIKAPVVLSLEVGEHIPAQYAKRYIEFINEAEPRMVIFSAAQIGQGGDGHINCQPKSYWCTRFEWFNYTYDPHTTKALIDYVNEDVHMGWFVNNVMVFYKNS